MIDFSTSSNKKKEPKMKDYSVQENPLSIYCHFIYVTLGKILLKNKNFKDFFKKSIYNKKYEDILKKANLNLVPDEYLLAIFLTVVLGLIIISGVSFFLLAFNPINSFLVFFGGLISIVVIGIFLYNYPIVVSKSRGTEIDASLVYILPYLKILSKELNLSKIIDIIDDFLIYKEIKVEFSRIKYYSNFLGYDVHSSIREAMVSCPSKDLSDLMNDLVTISNSGGSIYNYLDRKLSNLNTEIEAEEKKNIETLLIYSQIYIVILLIAPLFFTVMVAILDIIDFSTSTSQAGFAGEGGSIVNIIFMLFFLPIVYVGFMLLIYYSKPLYTRLVPIKNAKE